MLLGATLVSGMLWGRVTWGVYWTWDARLTTTALLFVFVLGYLAVRRLPIERDRRSRLAAVVGLLLGPTTIVCHYATTWWRTLHQGPTISRLDPQIDGLMLFTLMLGMVVFAPAVRVAARSTASGCSGSRTGIEDMGLDARARGAAPRRPPTGARWSPLRERRRPRPCSRCVERHGVPVAAGPALLVRSCSAAIAVLVVRSVQRGRRLSRQVPEEQRRWM